MQLLTSKVLFLLSLILLIQNISETRVASLDRPHSR